MMAALLSACLQIPLNGAGPMLIYNKSRSYQVTGEASQGFVVLV